MNDLFAFAVDLTRKQAAQLREDRTMITDAFKKIGFEVSNFDSVRQGTALRPPVYSFIDAWEVVNGLYDEVTGEYNRGTYLVCYEPGTGNIVDSYDLMHTSVGEVKQ